MGPCIRPAPSALPLLSGFAMARLSLHGLSLLLATLERERCTRLPPWFVASPAGNGGERARVFFPEATNVLLPYTSFFVFLFLATASAHLTSAPHSRTVLGDIVRGPHAPRDKGSKRELLGMWTLPSSRFNSNYFTHGRLLSSHFFFRSSPSVETSLFPDSRIFLSW